MAKLEQHPSSRPYAFDNDLADVGGEIGIMFERQVKKAVKLGLGTKMDGTEVERCAYPVEFSRHKAESFSQVW